MKKIVIAIDGFSSCGKSTLAKALSKKLDYAYVDSGAMYRAVTFYFLKNNVSFTDPAEIEQALGQIKIHFERIAGANHVFLNQKDIEEEIRSMEVSNWVSEVSSISAVRKAMVKLQQALGTGKGIVMDGRDIGTVVFPTAELKIFVTADKTIRAERRYQELLIKGYPVHKSDIVQNLEHRDHLDSTRADSPLRRAKDAVEIDNSNLTEKEQLDQALELAYERILATAH